MLTFQEWGERVLKPSTIAAIKRGAMDHALLHTDAATLDYGQETNDAIAERLRFLATNPPKSVFDI